jgi:hypothetical protein
VGFTDSAAAVDFGIRSVEAAGMVFAPLVELSRTAGTGREGSAGFTDGVVGVGFDGTGTASG